MSEILQAHELQAHAQGTAQQAEPVVDMRNARLLPASAGKTDAPHLPLATVTATHLEIGDSNSLLIQSSYSLDSDSEEGLDVKGLLTQLLSFPRPADGVVPNAWGNDKRAEVKRISTEMDSVYTLDRRVTSVIEGIRQDILELRRRSGASGIRTV